MTSQEVFDRVVAHLRAQGRKSTAMFEAYGTTRERCAYRGSDGSKCAAGVLIRDEDYTPDMENRSAEADPVVGALKRAGVTDVSLVGQLQEIHDATNIDTPLIEWEPAFRRLADRRGLTYRAPDAKAEV